MPLIGCPACGRQISTEAEACPQCGHPNNLVAEGTPRRKCYACAAEATLKCQKCGRRGCMDHIVGQTVGFGQYALNAMLCKDCGSRANTYNWVALVLIAIVLLWVLGTFMR